LRESGNGQRQSQSGGEEQATEHEGLVIVG